MTLKELKNKVDVTLGNGYNTYRVTINYRGKEYTCSSHNSVAYDLLTTYWRGDYTRCKDDWYTPKKAYQSFYDECKDENELS